MTLRGQPPTEAQTPNSVDSESESADTLSSTSSGRGSADFAVRGALFLIFTLSGFAGLIYESIWSHYLKLFLGHASYAQTLVLVVFMGGLGIGSALASRYCSRWRNLLLIYAIVEGIVGFSGLHFHTLFDWGTGLAYSVIFPSLDSPLAIQAVKWSIAALLILSQSILLGMTFPLISGALIRRYPEALGRSIATLYFTNSLGAAIGVLVSGFVLISWVGLPGTIMTAGLLSLLLAMVVWLMSRNPRWKSHRSETEARAVPIESLSSLCIPLLMIALVTGAASFMYEIAWIRMLSHVLGSSTHAFELILSAFILGLACGSLWVRRRIDRWSDPMSVLGMIQITMGVLALATLLSYSQSFEVMSFAMGKLQATVGGYSHFNVVSHVIAFGVMLPATFCAGMTLPLVTRALLDNGYGERSVGAVYAANTVGAIIGIVVAVHLAMPALGLKGLVILGAGLDIGLGLYILLRIIGTPATRRVLSAGAVGASAILATFLFVRLDPNSTTSAVYQYGKATALPGIDFQFHRDGKTATVDLLSYPVGVRALTTNGKTEATINMVEDAPVTSDEVTMVLLGAIPLAARPDAGSAVVIGFGSGLTTHVLLGSESLETVDTIEIEPAMVEASQWFRPRVERAYSDSRSQVYIDDARSFFSTQRKRYDIVISEPSQPWVSGVSNLYSSEFYALVKSQLSDSGIFAQWLQMRRINPVLVASVVGAISKQFSRFAVYNTNGRDILILASDGGNLDLDFQRVIDVPELAQELKRIGVHHAQDLSARNLGNASLMRSYYGSFSASKNSDYFPVLDQNAFRAQYLGQTATELFTLRSSPLPVIQMLESHASRRDATHVSADSPVKNLREIHAATLLRDFYAGRTGLDTSALPIETRNIVLATEGLLKNCGGNQDSEALITNINSISDRLTPFLQPDELDRIWQRFEKVACVETWSIHLRRWFSLVKAASARDARSMATISTQLLETGEDALDPRRMPYLVATSILGHVSVGDRENAIHSWTRFGTPGIARGEYGAVIRLLVAYSET